ncbi:MAG: hypothetical protein JSS27_10280 [Planctomycetes bacterium]|nr:hypothetical protein [Planctomycetota bacterium]
MTFPRLLAEGLAHRAFEWGRLQTDTDTVVTFAGFVALLVYVVYVYRRDAVELGRFWSMLLIGLRFAALTALLIVYLQPQWRNERDLVQPSRVVLLVDTSLSMDIDRDVSPPLPRYRPVVDALGQGDWLAKLRKVHDVVVGRFDEDNQRVALLPREAPVTATTSAATTPAAVADEPNAKKPKTDWAKELAPRGSETRLSQAVVDTIGAERSEPLAGVVVISDGQQNGGAELAQAVAAAREANVPVYTVGLGSSKPAVQVRVSDLMAPLRAYPADSYTVTGYVQSQGLAGQTVTVELLSERTGGAGDKAPEPTAPKLEGTEQVVLPDSTEPVPVRFDIKPSAAGKYLLTFRVKAPAEDLNPADNHRAATVDVVDRKTSVLLFAGGAGREYQFVRNLLRRDKDVEVDVLLQTGSQGISQDAREVLDKFPATRQELFAYDCLIAFDPDWRMLSAEQVEMVDQWVSHQAGGMILIAGPVFMDAWVPSPAMDKIRNLYPVEFHRRFAVIEDARFGSRQPWPVEFTRDGLEAPFLWLADTPALSAENWSKFRGVYGYYSVRGPKLDATVYARFSDPRAVSNDQQPVYMAGRYFGQVFYLGSGEMWRLRSVGEGYFETFYTKLVRHVSQGRLMRGSQRGVLLVSRDRCRPGDLVELHATVSDARLQPLEAPQVTATVVTPDGAVQNVTLARDASRAGAFQGTYVVRGEGTYRAHVAVPDSPNERLLAPPIQVTIPDRERDQVERNDALLGELAKQTGGQYYQGLDAAISGDQSVAAQLRDASRTTTLTGTPDKLWDNEWMLGAIVGALCIEWTLRRLLKLA